MGLPASVCGHRRHWQPSYDTPWAAGLLPAAAVQCLHSHTSSPMAWLEAPLNEIAMAMQPLKQVRDDFPTSSLICLTYAVLVPWQSPHAQGQETAQQGAVTWQRNIIVHITPA